MSIEQLLSSNIRIIQSSPSRTASTVLSNILYGLFCYDLPIYFNGNSDYKQIKDNFIVKTHNNNFDYIENKNQYYKLFFVCSERSELSLTIDIQNRSKPNVIIFDYNELLETKNLSIKQIVSNTIIKLQQKIPDEVMKFHNINLGIKRVLEMNSLYETIKDKPFLYVDRHYHLHGSHRNRGSKKSKNKK